VFPLSSRVIPLVELNRIRDAEDAALEARERFPQVVGAYARVLEVQYHLGNISALRRGADSLASSSNLQLRSWARLRLAELALLDGRPDEWERLRIRAAVANAERESPNDPLVDAATSVIVDAAVRGSATRALRRLDAALDSAPLRVRPDIERPYAFVVRAYATAGRADKARAVLAEYERDVTDSALRRINEAAYLTMQAQVAAAEGRHADAIDGFRRGAMLPDGPATACTICLPFALAAVFDAAGQADSAIAMYVQYLTTPHYFRFNTLFDPVYLALTHHRLGELYAVRGDRTKAIEHYRAFVALWANAEPALQPKVADARRRVAELERAR
jgi:tetratricopeptide (TPR) repeat protein